MKKVQLKALTSKVLSVMGSARFMSPELRIGGEIFSALAMRITLARGLEMIAVSSRSMLSQMVIGIQSASLVLLGRRAVTAPWFAGSRSQ